MQINREQLRSNEKYKPSKIKIKEKIYMKALQRLIDIPVRP